LKTVTAALLGLDAKDWQMDVARWLQGLGLERYEAAFRDNEIDWQVLSSLTADDLKEIGITAVGHRRRLIEAIAALRTEAEPAPTAPRTEGAERRQLTVMFCDLVGSTALAARLDPEDLRDIIAAYHRAVAEAAAGSDGFVAKYMGDGVLVYFGYPRAHEDDAEHAVPAGLDCIDAAAAVTVKFRCGHPGETQNSLRIANPWNIGQQQIALFGAPQAAGNIPGD
jgi:hypothetical protein